MASSSDSSSTYSGETLTNLRRLIKRSEETLSVDRDATCDQIDCEIVNRKSGLMRTSKYGPCPCHRCHECLYHREERLQYYNDLCDNLSKVPICRLPAEIMVKIVNQIDLIDFPNFMIATFHTLRHHNIVPPYSSNFLKKLILEESDTQNLPATLKGIPKELLLSIGMTMTPSEKVHLTLAAHPMTPEEIEIITHM